MELGTGIAVAGLGLTGTGVFAIIMRFLSAQRDRESDSNNYSPPSDYATKDDVRNVEKRMDNIFSQISDKIEKKMQEIRDQLHTREERCIGRAERIASIEKAQQENEKRVEAICRRSDFKDAEERGPGVVGFGKR
ncbi:MAG: hypothetical protein V5B78_12935, partial [Desulfohalobiaceae bacterium]